VRRIVALGVAGFALSAPGLAHAAGESISLRTDHATPGYGTVLHFSGSISPTKAGVRVHVYRVTGSGNVPLLHGTTKANGSFRLGLRIKKPGTFVAKASIPTGGGPVVVTSGQVAIRVKPRLATHFVGKSVIGGRLRLSGTLSPAGAGVLRRTTNGKTRLVKVGRSGRFAFNVPTGAAKLVRIRLVLTPVAGYAARNVARPKRITGPYLSQGARGYAVSVLERQLRSQRYLLRAIDRTYADDTTEAVWAFQKVHGLSRTGRVTPGFWKILARSRTPLARVRHGDHIEISKTKQVIYEVRAGKVVNVIHTSTGATGNTPVGTWHVYYKVPGYNAIQMYYSMFFIGNFAIHGYHSVPPYPASHGCSRIPLWAAPGLFSRWGMGATVYVFP
jgi:peptidoglycan hydrolase-like protein with peptidoglycan-binding domain